MQGSVFLLHKWCLFHDFCCILELNFKCNGKIDNTVDYNKQWCSWKHEHLNICFYNKLYQPSI